MPPGTFAWEECVLQDVDPIRIVRANRLASIENAVIRAKKKMRAENALNVK